MSKTRQNIIQTAIQLFNERGVVNVSFRDIGDVLNMSPGNVTYHYKTKQELMESVYRFMIKTLEEMSVGNQLMNPTKDHLQVARGYLEHIVQFRFFYQDTLEIIRSFPELAKLHQQQVGQEKAIIRNLMFMSVGKGDLVSEAFDGLYESLAHSIWMTLHFWLTQQIIRGEPFHNLDAGLVSIANLLYPYATEKGKKIFEKMRNELMAVPA
ncbi:MAG: TetR/AcrR family transcriptional regulator [Bacteroidota bacterium]